MDIEWTLVFQFCFLDDLKLYFLLDASIFITIDGQKEEQQSTQTIPTILKDVSEEKKCGNS